MCRFLLLLEFFVFLNYKSQRNFVWFSFSAYFLLLWLSCTPHCHHSLALLHILVRLIDFFDFVTYFPRDVV